MIRDRRCIAALAVALAVALAAAPAAAQRAPEGASGWNDRAAVEARRFIAATANPHATDAAYAMLARGGSAVDAAIAAQLVLGLVEPQSSGLGGGAFMLVHDAPSGRLHAYDGRETAPAAATPARFLTENGSPAKFDAVVATGLSVGVPGLVRLLELAHRKHGRLPWASLFEPAIALADQGFVVSPRLATLIAADRHLAGSPRAAAYFHDAAGKPLEAGARLRNPAYAATLRTLSREGANAFYTGAIAADIVSTVRSHLRSPGDLTLADLAGYRAVEREPACGAYRRYRVCGMPPPSSGGTTVLAILGMLERFDLAAMGVESFWSAHVLSEAGRLAYADRNRYVGDPAFVDVPAGIVGPAYLRERSRLIPVTGSLGRAAAGDPPREAHRRKVAFADAAALELPSTSHLSIVDARGGAVSMTTTIEDAFGSRLMTASGFLLNNQLTDFSFAPEQDGRAIANRVEPGKRPRSSMAPTIVYDAAGRVRLVVGSPGGSSIINYVAKTIVAVLDWGLDPQAAVALPNLGSRNGPTELEAGTAAAGLAPKLRAMGHEVAVIPMTSGTQAVVRTRDGLSGGADPRREGTVRGR
ncbi:MAG TPA: gamma-glutamyltransferase [Casimicrobiaceae bacterium]|nr:gamma-glutamyltransferase [Casimicrobiaceae bacterium]